MFRGGGNISVVTEIKDNFRPALYYPYIHIRSEEWLKATLLCVPVVKRLVPDGYSPEDDPKIAPYLNLKGPYGELLQAVPAYSFAADQAQKRLLSKIETEIDIIRKKFGRRNAPAVDKYWIHDAKFSYSLLSYLEEHELAWHSAHSEAYGSRSWYALHPILGKAVMTCIGLSTAQEQNFDIVTADGKFHEALLTTDEDAIFEILLRTNNRPQPNKKHDPVSTPQARRDLGQLVIVLADVNLRALLPEHIPELQESKKFKVFQNILRASTSRIDRDTDPDEFDRQLQEEAEQIVSAWRDASNDLRKGLREALFEGVALAAETVKTLVKGPEVFELVIVGGLGLWRLATKAGQFAEYRRKGHHFLSQIHRAESDVLQIQYPLGLTE